MRHVLVILCFSLSLNGMYINQETTRSANAAGSGNNTITLTLETQSRNAGKESSGCGCGKCFTTLASGVTALRRLFA